MRFNLMILLFVISSSASARDNCARNAENQARAQLLSEEHSRRAEFGMNSDNRRIYPPNRCTPFMQDARFIPLAKRQAAGANRERFMDADCNVYEWDSQHGNFEKYVSNGNTLRHAGDVSPVHGIANPDKARASRNYEDNNTGYSGLNLNQLCRQYQSGRLRPNQVRTSGLRCI